MMLRIVKKLEELISEKVIETLNSPINGEIKVVMKKGQPILLVNDVVQSGSLMEVIWKQAFPQFGNKKVKSCLLLGVGGGSIVKQLTQKWPEISITGIEIDEVVIKVGVNYFGLGNIANFKVINDDAVNYVQKTKDKFDLCIINLFIGPSIPEKSEENGFLKNVGGILEKDGAAVFNRFYLNEDKKKTDSFELELKQVFGSVVGYNIFNNRVFICSN